MSGQISPTIFLVLPAVSCTIQAEHGVSCSGKTLETPSIYLRGVFLFDRTLLLSLVPPWTPPWRNRFMVHRFYAYAWSLGLVCSSPFDAGATLSLSSRSRPLAFISVEGSALQKTRRGTGKSTEVLLNSCVCGRSELLRSSVW